MRKDLNIIQQWIQPNARVLDLACGSGDLLHFLKQEKNILGTGLEINTKAIEACVIKGVDVIEHNLNDGLTRFKDKSFDVVVMTQALQVVRHPDLILQEMLRIGKECVITIPNFGHWQCRFYLSFKGKMPVSEFMPYTWYNTPNIHFCTIDDFAELCHKNRIDILNKTFVDYHHNTGFLSNLWPNLFAETAIYRLANSD